MHNLRKKRRGIMKPKHHILIVDDMGINREMLREMLESNYAITEASSGVEAVSIALDLKEKISLILLDLIMPEMDGFETLRILKASPVTRNIPVIFISAANSAEYEVRGLRLGAADFISKPFNPDVVKTRIELQLKLNSYQKHMSYLVNEQVNRLERVQDKMIDLLATIVEYWNLESGNHIKRTRVIVTELINILKDSGRLDPSIAPIDQIYIPKAVTLHDIGKIAIPDQILTKPAKLTFEEFEIMKKHTVIGTEIIDRLSGIQMEPYIKHAREVCLYHHEKWDGTGYPKGLTKEEIPYSARLMALVDVYDALLSKRAYKEAFSLDKTIKIIKEGRGSHFDPVICDAFLENSDIFYDIYKNYAD